MKIAIFFSCLFAITISFARCTYDKEDRDQDEVQRSSYEIAKFDETDDLQGVRYKRFPKFTGGITETQKQQILDGIEGAASFFKFLVEKDFFKTLTKISSVAGPIFTIASTVISIVFLFMDIESPEMALMKKEFSQLNNRIDRWGIEFKEIKKMIEWSAVQVKFGDVENSILTLHKLIAVMPDLPSSAKEAQANVFINKYETDYKSAGDVLYLAMINVDRTYSENLFKACQKHTSYYRSKVQAFMVGLVQLLTQAIQIEATYINLKYANNEDYSNYVKSTWEKKLTVLKEKMTAVDLDTMNRFPTQYEIDLDDTLKSNPSASNKQFKLILHRVLANKYDWREWFVLVYKELSGFKDHTYVTCQGTHRFRSYGRNVIVSSVDKFDGDEAMSHIEQNAKLIGSYSSWKSDRDYANGWVAFMRKNLPTCGHVDTIAAIAWGSDAWFVNNRLVVHKVNCVNNKPPCYYTFLFA